MQGRKSRIRSVSVIIQKKRVSWVYLNYYIDEYEQNLQTLVYLYMPVVSRWVSSCLTQDTFLLLYILYIFDILTYVIVSRPKQPINKTLHKIVTPDLCISSLKIITNVYFSPTEPSPVHTEIPSTFRPRLFPVQKVFARN